MDSLADLTTNQRRQIRDQILVESSKPLTVAVMGQTGVGKSSLLNALFDTSLETGDVRPTTKVAEPVTSTGIPATRLPSGICLESASPRVPTGGTCRCTGRSSSTATSSYGQSMPIAARRSSTRTRSARWSAGHGTMSAGTIAKISLVLTKADLLTPPAWIYFRDGDTGTFVPGKVIRERMPKRPATTRRSWSDRMADFASTSTYMSDDFNIDDPRFDCGEYSITYHGFMSDTQRSHYAQLSPRFAAVFERLCDNQRVIPYSALFRYNLSQLLVAVVNKLGENAIGRFQRLVDGSAVTSDVPVARMAKYCNLMVWDKQRGSADLRSHRTNQYPGRKMTCPTTQTTTYSKRFGSICKPMATTGGNLEMLSGPRTTAGSRSLFE